VGGANRVTARARAFSGRPAAYDSALDADPSAGDAGEDGEEGLEAVLRRNIYGADDPDSGEIGQLLRYVRGAEAALAGQPDEALLAGEVALFAAPGESAGPEASGQHQNPGA
jgi:hypothetical protein